MKFLKLDIENFLTIGKATINLNNRGLLLIQGLNDDDSSAKSNGAGKSSLTDALSWVLYGKTARDVTGDDVVNHTAKKDCKVSVVIQDNEKLYEITRHRKHSEHKNSLLVNFFDGSCTVDLTKGTSSETQSIIEMIIGCSYDVFTSSIYAGQEKMPNLPAMTDRFLKTLIEEASGIEVLEQAYIVARDKLRCVSENALKIENQLNKLVEKANDRIGIIKSLNEKQEEFEVLRDKKIREKLSQGIVEKNKIDSVKETLVTLDLNEIELKELKSEIETELSEMSSYHEKLREAEKELLAKESNLTLANKETSNLANNINNLAKEIKNISATVGTPCSSCGKEICEHDIESAKEAKLKLAKEMKNDFERSREIWQNAKTEVDNAKAKVKEVERLLPDITKLTTALNSVNKDLKILSDHHEQIQSHKDNILRIKEEANAIKNEVNPYIEQIQNFKEEIENLKSEIKKLITEKKLIEKQVELAEKAVLVFGPSGVRSHILDTVTPYLNERTAQYLGVLSDGNITAQWTTLTKTSKGELKEKFAIIVKNNKGANSFDGLSGGEKRKVRLATCMALQDLVASRATKPIDLFIADEIDDALDGAGIERLMTVLNQKARERGTVLVISHNDLKDEIDLVITVNKNGGSSTVSGDV